jgi:hypothetical protein
LQTYSQSERPFSASPFALDVTLCDIPAANRISAKRVAILANRDEFKREFNTRRLLKLSERETVLIPKFISPPWAKNHARATDKTSIKRPLLGNPDHEVLRTLCECPEDNRGEKKYTELQNFDRAHFTKKYLDKNDFTQF